MTTHLLRALVILVVAGASARATDHVIPIKVLVAKPGKLFRFVAKGSFSLPDAGDDPTTEGGALCFQGTGGGATYTIAAGDWKGLGPGADGSKGYKAKGASCRAVVVKETMVKGVCAGDTGTLLLPETGNVNIALSIGDGTNYCGNCGGTPKGNPERILKRTDCASSGVCACNGDSTTTTTSTTTSSSIALCGDGVLQADEICDDGGTVGGDGCSASCEHEGCANGSRVGFVDYGTYVDIAACGTLVAYGTARDTAGTVCATGWHQCIPYGDELNTILSGLPQPAEGLNAWLNYDDPACNIQDQFATASCRGSVSQSSHFNSSGGCHPSGLCGEGYRPVVATGSAWTWSLRGGGVGGPCTDHITFLCAFSGGSVPPQTAYTACCRD